MNADYCSLCEGECEAEGMIKGIHDMADGRFATAEEVMGAFLSLKDEEEGDGGDT